MLASLEPRTKVLGLLGYSVAVFLAPDFLGEAVVGGFLFLFLFKKPALFPSLLRSLKPALPLLAVIFCLQLFPGGRWGEALFLLLRLLLLLAAASLVSLTTSPLALADALGKLLAPLGRLGFPAAELSLASMLALRFIPVLREEAARILKAQVSRGAPWETGGILLRLRSFLLLAVPLLVSAFRRAENLALALEARGYALGAKRTSLYPARFGKADAFVLVSLSLLLLYVSWLR